MMVSLNKFTIKSALLRISHQETGGNTYRHVYFHEQHFRIMKQILTADENNDPCELFDVGSV